MLASGNLPGGFEDELLSFPVGDHDDFVDALAYSFAALGMLSTGPMTLQVASL